MAAGCYEHLSVRGAPGARAALGAQVVPAPQPGEVALGHGRRARLQLRDYGAPGHREPLLIRPAAHKPNSQFLSRIRSAGVHSMEPT